MKRFALVLALILALLLCACSGGDPAESTAAAEHTPTQDQTLTLTAAGRQRLTYTGNISSVRYVTDVDRLPDVEGMEVYDEEFFQSHALVFVTESVSSGSFVVDFESVTVQGGAATVSLRHEMPDEAGTCDMATWLIWAVVPRDLDCTWSVANPMLQSEVITD